MEIIIIAAMAENRVIGKDNVMPWNVKGDLARFKELTMGWPCIMGRKTWESLPKKPLPGRLNVVVSKTLNENDPSVSSVSSCLCVKSSLESAIEHCSYYEKIFIIGGESIYKQAMPLATKIELTLIPGNYEGDTFFPEIDEKEWKVIEKNDFDTFSLITYNKID